MKKLEGKVVVASGASRGAGRGIARVLGEAGATVYVVARTSRRGPPPEDGAPGTVEETAEEVTARGGTGIAIRADLSVEEETAAVFQRVDREQGRLDLLVNSAWTPNFMVHWSKRFWELDYSLWMDTHRTLSVCWLTSVHAIPLMQKTGGGLVLHVTDNLYPDLSAYRGQILHDLGHEFTNRLIQNMSRETDETGVAVAGLNPGFMRTERVLMSMKNEALKKQFRFDLSESPEYIGRAVAALLGDSDRMKRNGQLLWVANLADEYGFDDTDGRRVPLFDPEAPEREMPA